MAWKAHNSHGVPKRQEFLRGKDLTEQPGQGRMTVRASNDHEGGEQLIAGQAGYRISFFQEGAGRQVPKGCLVVKRGAEQPGKR